MGTYSRTVTSSDNSGIYCIRNIITNRRYIGQADDIKNRFMRHRSELKHNRHFNRHLQSSYNKYGADVFEYTVVEYCPISELDDREKFWIDYYNSTDQNYGYNISEGGLGCRGYKHTEEEISKMRLIQKPKPIVQLSLGGEYINTFVSAGEGAASLGKDSSSGIKRCCEKNKYKQAYGYIWVYKEDYDSDNVDWDYYFSGLRRNKPVMQFDLEMNLIREWANTTEAGEEGFNQSQITETCNGKYRTYKGYIWMWKYSPEIYLNAMEKRDHELKEKMNQKSKTIIQIDSNTNEELREYTRDEIIKNKDWVLHTIQACCNGHVKTAYGYKWRYKE